MAFWLSLYAAFWMYLMWLCIYQSQMNVMIQVSYEPYEVPHTSG